ncbi:MAG: hypothetical protein LBS18_04890 [Clostridiales bacterium]|jgi:hypothetical protein|nr:hypothetical protein [Clostridiales bacterium]
MEEERDVVVFSDDDGNEFELDVIDYFEHEGQEYAVLMDLSDLPEEDDEDEDYEDDEDEDEDEDEDYEDDEDDEDEDCDCDEQDVYIMKVVVNGDTEEFLPADDDLLDTLADIVGRRLNSLDEE